MATVTINGQGPTVDQTTQLNSAMAALSNGDRLVMNGKAGVNASGLVLTGKTGVSVVGQNANSGFRLLNAVTTGFSTWMQPALLRILGCTDIMVDNLLFDCTGFSIGGIGLGKNGSTACTDCVIQANRLTNPTGTVPTNQAIAAISVASGGSRNRIIGNRVYNWGTVGSASHMFRGIWVGTQAVGAGEIESDFEIVENIVQAVGYSGIVGFWNGGLVAGNRVIGCGGAGVVPASSAVYASRDTTISGNYLANNLMHGIQGDPPDDTGPQLINIHAVSNQCYENGYHGIWWKNVTGGSVLRNVCRNNGSRSGSPIFGTGILIYNCSDIQVQSNNCYDTRDTGSRTQNSGIEVRAHTNHTSDNIRLWYNKCRGNGGVGNSSVYDNGITAYAFIGASITNLDLRGNWCADSDRYGIALVCKSAPDPGVALTYRASGNTYRDNALGSLYTSGATEL